MGAAGQENRWGAGSRPRLASKVRLQWNAARKQSLLLYPEGALVLNPTAQAVLELCDGRRTLAEIVRDLASRFQGSAGAGPANEAGSHVPQPGTPSAEQVELSTDPGTSSPDEVPATLERRAEPSSPSTVGQTEPASTLTPASATERERVVERDVVAFLERLDQRGWMVDEAQ